MVRRITAPVTDCVCWWRRHFRIGISTAKIEIYNPISNSSFYVPPEQARALAKDNPHKWVSSKRLILGPDRNLKVTWEPKQSGEHGPLVLQVVT